MLSCFFMAIALYISYLGLMSNLGWKRTLAALILLSFLSILTFFSLTTYRGYPAKQSLLTKQEMISAHIQYPTTHQEGRIFLWLIKTVGEPSKIERYLFKRDRLHETPRAYEIPYTKENEKKIKEAQKAKENGMLVDIENQKKPSNTNNSDTISKGVNVIIIDPRQMLQKG